MRTPTFHPGALLFLIIVLLAPAGAWAAELNLPADATEGIQLMYSGRQNEADALFRKIVAENPEHPMGYLFQADALWWKIYCVSLEVKYNTVDVWNHAPSPEDDQYLALADKVSQLAEAAIAKSDTAEMELYAGLGYAARARLTGMRGERRATARAGVEGRKHLLRCIQLDPNMADAYFGLGMYNYYVDTLSALAKILRFFMGIPGGDKNVGLRQLQIAISKGELTSVEARFYMASSLRTFDHDYTRSAPIASPLATKFPQNPLFLLLVGDIEAGLGHRAAAGTLFRSAAAAPVDDSACARQIQQVVRDAMAVLDRQH